MSVQFDMNFEYFDRFHKNIQLVLAIETNLSHKMLIAFFMFSLFSSLKTDTLKCLKMSEMIAVI